MKKFTKEEISLCKQVVEKEKDWSRVDWGSFVLYQRKIWVVINYFKSPNHPVINIADDKDHRDQIYNVLKLTPLWNMSDCLEFLREKGFQTFLIMELAKGWGCDGYIGNKIYSGEGKSILEACLKVVLAVLLEDK